MFASLVLKNYNSCENYKQERKKIISFFLVGCGENHHTKIMKSQINLILFLIFLMINFNLIFSVFPSTTIGFSYTGASQSFSVPSGVTSLTISITGASGGADGIYLGGLGATVQTTLTVTAGSIYYINVGGAGTARVAGDVTTVYAGGFNGGGKSGMQVSKVYN
jgi:hypothetical protein